MKIINKDKLILSGTYLVTDPCYVVPDHQWGEFCDLLKFDRGQVVIEDDDGREFIVSSTRWGDGGYGVMKDGVEIGTFGVDAGLYAFIKGADGFKDPTYRSSLGVVAEFEGELTFQNCDAFLNGKLIVDTSGDNGPYEDDDDDDWDDDEDEDV